MNSGTFPSGIDLSGDTVSGNPNTVQAGTSVTIRATDEDNNFNDLVVSFPAVTAGGSFDANGFSTVTPFNHNVTGTQFDSEWSYIEQQELHVMMMDIIQQVIMLMDSIEQINGMHPTMRMMTYQEHKSYAN